MLPISNYLTKKSLLLVAILTLLPIVSLANMSEKMTSIKESKKKLNYLVKEANKYYLDSIDALEKRQDAITKSVSEDKQDISIDYLKAEFKRLESDTATIKEQLCELDKTIIAAQNDQDLEDAVDEFVVELYDSQCNPSAIASLDRFDTFLNKDYIKKTFKKDREVLRKYEEYAKGIDVPLDSVYRELNREGWSKQEEGSDILKDFDKLWKKVEYLKHFGKKGERINFLDKIVQRVQDMRTLGFKDQKEEFKEIRELLKPNDQPIATPIDNLLAKKELYDKLNNGLANNLERMRQINNEIDMATQTYNDINEFKDIDKKVNQNYTHWFEMRKEIDTEILSYCSMCLSEPADEMGDNFKLREAVKKELMDFAQSDATKKKVETYKILFDNYYDYTMEIREVLKKFVSLRKAEGRTISAEQKNPALNALHNLQYWNYYKNRNNKDAASSPHLDKILGKYESWLNSNFKGVSLEEYNKLGQDLMGIKKNKASDVKVNTDEEQTEKLLDEIGDKLKNTDEEGSEEGTSITPLNQ